MYTILSLYDYTGNWSRPYREAGYNVIQVDIKHGIDIMNFEYKNIEGKVGLLIAQPCTDYSLSGAKYFKKKDLNGQTEQSQKLVNRSKELIDYYDSEGRLIFWSLENPMSRIHTLNLWLGKPKLKFNPCDYAGYDPNPNDSRYNKRTWLWGRFNDPVRFHLPPIETDNPGWKNLGGKSERTKELRSITPLGFAYAFYYANN